MISKELKEDMKKWEECAKIYITSGTGSGKTYFIINEYIPYCLNSRKSVLILCNRSALKQQIEHDIMQMIYREPLNCQIAKEWVKIETYQLLEQELITNGIDFCKKKYGMYNSIVCDEAHYFLSDSTFNTNTVHSFSFIINSYEFKQCIFMSATIERVKEELEKQFDLLNKKNLDSPVYPKNISAFWNKKRYIYSQPVDYSYLQVYSFADIMHLIELIEDNKGKWLIFVSSFKEAQKLYDNLNAKKKRRIGFCCSKKDDVIKNYDGRDIEEIKKMLAKEEKFTEDILISTAVLDNGISMKDGKLLNIAVLTDNKESFLQMIGRKRISDGENVRLYLCIRNKIFFANKKNKAQSVLEEYYYMFNEQQNKIGQYLLQSYSKPNTLHQYMTVAVSNVTAPGRPVLFIYNYLSIMQLQYLCGVYNDISNGLENDANYFIKKQLEWMDLNENGFTNCVLERKYEILQEIINYLKKAIKEPVDHGTLSELLNNYRQTIHENIDATIRMNESVTWKKLNSIFEEYHMHVCIKSEKNKNRKTVYYIEELAERDE